MTKKLIVTLLFSLIVSSVASAMPAIYVDLNIDKPGIQSERTAVVGETFRIALVLRNEGKTDVQFDEALLGVFYNDRESDILSVTPTVYPHAGSLAGQEGTLDFFSRSAVSYDQELTLLPIARRNLPAGFKNASGQAGIANYENPWTLRGDNATDDTIGHDDSSDHTIAAGKLNAGFLSLGPGTSSVLATGPDGTTGLWLNGEQIPVRHVPGHVTVIEQTNR